MPSELKPCPHETVSWNSWTKVNTCDKCFVIVDRPEPATPAGDDALVEELARVLWIAGRNRAGIWDGTESDRWTAYGEGHKPEYRRRALTILPIIARERAAAHAAGRADERAEVVALIERNLMSPPQYLDAIERG